MFFATLNNVLNIYKSRLKQSGDCYAYDYR